MSNLPDRMAIADLMRDFTTGDGDTDWAAERATIDEVHPGRIAALTESIKREGIRNPIRLDQDATSVIDGHHRIFAALDAGLTEVPVADAWDGSDWGDHTAWEPGA